MLNKNPDLYYYDNPDSLQQDIINHLKDITNNQVSNINPNTTFGFQLDTFTTIISYIVKGIEEKLGSVYPKRAQNMKDLYQFISDFDYVAFQANPSSLKLKLTIPKLILIQSALEYDEFYNLLVIPKDTLFKVGNYDFGIYYNIFIKINKNSNNIIINYDTTESNPLDRLDNYNIPFDEFKYNGVTYITFEIPIFQFTKVFITENIDNTLGFKKSYKIEDKFYAVRVYDLINKKELSYSLSDIVYDPLYPTCIIKYLQNTNELLLNIPQIYFSNSQLSKKLLIEIYTTKGKLDVNIDNTNIDLVKALYKLNIGINSEYESLLPYVQAIKNINNFIFSISSNKISGGKDNDSFLDIKKKVIYDLYSNRTLISYNDIKNYFESFGYKVTTNIDNLTKRVYYIYKYILDQDEKRILLVNAQLLINTKLIDFDDSNTYYMTGIKKFSNINYTILPNVVYNYDKERNIAIPLSKNEYDQFNRLSINDKIELLNNNTKLFYPYHLNLNLDKKYPKVISYDLFSCKITKFSFGKKHPYSPYQTYINDYKIEHLNNGTDGYKIYFGIKRNEYLSNIDINNLVFYGYLITNENNIVGKKLDYEYTTDDKLDVFSLKIDTDYNFLDNNISIKNILYPQHTGNTYLPLNTKLILVSYIKSNILNGLSEYQPYDIFNDHEYKELIENIYNTYITNDYIPIENYNIEISLGTSLSDILDNNITINYSPEEYDTYETSIPLTYEYDIYKKDQDGKLIYTIDNGNIVLEKLHSAGDIVYDDSGNIIYKYKKGDIKIDADGNYIIKSPRYININIDTFLLDYKYKLVSDFDISYLLNILNSYYDEIRLHRDNLYGNTLCYFKPLSTIGYKPFNIDNNTTILLNTNIKIGFKLYVRTDVINDTKLIEYINNEIYKITSNYLSKDIVSLTEIANEIQTIFNDYIYSIDILGFNDDQNLQTIIKISDEYDLTINQILYIDMDNKIKLINDLDLKFIQAE